MFPLINSLEKFNRGRSSVIVDNSAAVQIKEKKKKKKKREESWALSDSFDTPGNLYTTVQTEVEVAFVTRSAP